MEQGFYEKDWKLFSKKLLEWQANYIKKLNAHYVELLTRDLDPAQNSETIQSQYFTLDTLPLPLATEKVTRKQIELCFEANASKI